MSFLFTHFNSDLNFTWLCTNGQKHSPNNSDLGGCYGTSSISESVLTVNSGLLLENSSYFITVNVTKDQRQAEYTQEVFVVPGDPPEVQIRYMKMQECFPIKIFYVAVIELFL